MTFFDRAVVSGLGLTEDLGRVTALLHYTFSFTEVNTILKDSDGTIASEEDGKTVYGIVVGDQEPVRPARRRLEHFSFTDGLSRPCRPKGRPKAN
jgi:hypothetical protein